MRGVEQAGGGAPSWLFSFVDLAFLLLVAMTQVRTEGSVLPLGEMILPRVRNEASVDLPSASHQRWQLRVHPPAADRLAFELLGPDEAPVQDPLRISLADLRSGLDRIQGQGAHKPVLAPHEDSRTQDMLDAVDAIEERWPSRRRVAIERSFAAR